MDLTKLVSTNRSNAGRAGATTRNDLADAYAITVTAQTQLANVVAVLDIWSARTPLSISTEAQKTLRNDLRSVRKALAVAQESVDSVLAASHGLTAAGGGR